MQTYRLVIGPDGQVKIPNGEPGRTVTVLVEESLPRSLRAAEADWRHDP